MVGWFATGNEVTSHSALIHDYYARYVLFLVLPAQIPIGRETKDPIHLTLDTTLASGRVTMKAYVSAPLGVPGATSGSMFSPVQVELVAAEPEVAGLGLLYKTKYSKVGYARYGLGNYTVWPGQNCGTNARAVESF